MIRECGPAAQLVDVPRVGWARTIRKAVDKASADATPHDLDIVARTYRGRWSRSIGIGERADEPIGEVDRDLVCHRVDELEERTLRPTFRLIYSLAIRTLTMRPAVVLRDGDVEFIGARRELA